MNDTRTDVVVMTDKHQHMVVAQQQNYEQGTKLLAAIAEAAANPKVDVVKMKELMAMRREIVDEQRRVAFDAAFSQMQEELPEIQERGDISGESKRTGSKISQRYATFEDINKAVKPIMAKHGFGVRFSISDEQAYIRVTCILSHREGHREETSKLLPKDNTGSKNAVQAEGSSVSYGKRYTMCAILNIATRGQDDDGNAAVPPAEKPRITESQREIILKALGGPGEKTGEFCKLHKMTGLDRIRAEDFDRALAAAKRFAAGGSAPDNKSYIGGGDE